MKIFIYKSLFIFFIILILYHSTIGYSLKYLKIDLINYFDTNKISFFRDKLRDELKSSLKKKNILKRDDAELIKNFINKISEEIKNN